MAPKENSETEGVEIIPQEPKVFTLEILKIIKEVQQQHGLRHGDYQRYRGYCSRRLQRLRKVLKIPQGDKRHFKRKDVTPVLVKDDKFLQIPLMMSERAWSYAMQLRQESNTEPRKKFHLICRLRKAGAHALQLQELILNINCDARTKLEAEAYVAWIQGSINFELQLWKDAMENFKKAQVVYENLAAALPELEQIIYKARVDELEPNLRYCAYNIGDKTAIDDLMKMRGKLTGDILSNLDSLISQTRDKQTGSEEIFWNGKSCGTPPPKAAALLVADARINGTLEKTALGQEKVDILEAHLIDCRDAIAAVREELKVDLKSKDGTEKGPQHLLAYLQYIKLSRTLERNCILIAISKESEKAKPQDIVRLYEAALYNLNEMSQLQDDVEFLKEHDAKTKSYRAFRCYYLAESLAKLRRWKEAIALYQRSLQHVKDAMEHEKVLPNYLKKELNELQNQIEGAQSAAHASYILEHDQEDNLNSTTEEKFKNTYLEDRLDEYYEDPSVTTKNPKICRIPPPMRPIPCKPIFFDIAFNMVEFPDLSERLQDNKKDEKSGLAGLVKGIWGWGNKK